MENIYAKSILPLLLTCAVSVQATDWKCYKENKYNSTNMLVAETNNHIDKNGYINVQQNKSDNKITLYTYDANHNLLEAEQKTYAEYNNKWYSSIKNVYTYNEKNQKISHTYYSSLWDGPLF